MANKQDFLEFIRIDGSGKDVSGSNILRKKKPKFGNWRQLYPYQCCLTTTTSSTTSTTSSTTTLP